MLKRKVLFKYRVILFGHLLTTIITFLVANLFLNCKETKAGTKSKGAENMEITLIDLTKKDKWGRAVFAGGCFWCIEPPYEKLNGVKSAVSGYAGGKEEYPTYDKVSSKRTNHTESVLVTYDPKKVKYADLVEIFWQNIDPTQENGQFYDLGNEYKTVIFYVDEEQKKVAEQSKKKLSESGRFKKPVVTQILPLKKFWVAEEYHQDYYKKSPAHYYRYRSGSGRDAFIKKHWGK